jgi:hypothetical protein
MLAILTYFSKTTLKVLLTSVFRQAADVNLIWLQSTESEHQVQNAKKSKREQSAAYEPVAMGS